MRMVLALMPMGSKGLMSISRTSDISTPRSRSACRGRSPRRTVRLARMGLYSSFSICSKVVASWL